MRYDFVCDKHGVFEVWQGMSEEHKAVCPRCQQEARRRFAPLTYSVDFRDGYDPGMGEYVNTKKDRERFLREKGLRKQDKEYEGRWV